MPKVPTCIAYPEDGRKRWGFQTQIEDERTQVHEWFKVFFDEAEYEKAKHLRPEDMPPNHAAVKRYYSDFLQCLYSEIKRALSDNVRDWHSAHVEFLFSVPTTWTKTSLTQEFRRIAAEAGFGRDGPNHKLEVGLTEAEAAAVYTFNSQNAIYSVSTPFHIVN
jgi:hypothetical protein